MFTQQPSLSVCLVSRGAGQGLRAFSNSQVNRELQPARTPACHGPYSSCTKHTKEQTMSHILDIQPHHPQLPSLTPPFPPPPAPTRAPPPQLPRTSQGRQELLRCVAPNWLVGVVWWRKGRRGWRGRGGRDRDRERGEGGKGCFLFSQLIDSQMSGGVGCVALGGGGIKHPLCLAPPQTNTNTYTHVWRQKQHTHTHPCMDLWPYSVTHLFGKQHLRRPGADRRW